MSEYFLFRATQTLSKLLPKAFAYWIGMRIADLLFLADRRGRKAVKSNIMQILRAQKKPCTDRAARKMARKTFQNFGKYLVDFFRFTNIATDELRTLVTLENEEHLEQAKQMNKGVILVTAHFGNWELGGAVLAAMGNKIAAVVLPNNTPKTDELFQNQRKRRGMEVLPLGQAARRSIKALRNNEMVAMLCDRDFTIHNFPMEFFGQKARMPIGPAKIAAKTLSPVVPGFMIRHEDDSFTLKFHPPIVPGNGIGTDEIREKIRDIMQVEIAKNPSQWFIFEDYWRNKNE